MKSSNLKPYWVLIVLLFVAAGCSAPAPTTGNDDAGAPPSGPAPNADYGDAPDGGPTGYPDGFAQQGNFPTLFESDGARTLDVTQAVLGSTASAEMDANDPADPDGTTNLTNTDSDDGLVDFFIALTAIPPPTTMTVNVTAPEGSEGGQYWLNALIDLNMDGEWGGRGANGELEWVVQNQPVQVSPGVVTPFTPPPFAFSNGNLLPDGAFMRIALTKEMAPPNWDGTGEFSAGEIEDHFIKLPEIDDENGGKTTEPPILKVNCGGPYKPGAAVTCTVTNMRPVAGSFKYDLIHTGPGAVGVPIATCQPPPPGGPIPIGPNGVVAVTCQSTPGKAPDTWRFVARVQDPPAVVVPGGIHLGHSDASIADFNFEGSPKSWSVFIAGLMGHYEHFGSTSAVFADVAVYGEDPVPVAGAEVTLQITHPDGSTETQPVTTGADGKAQAKFTIYVYGDYVVEVMNIDGENMEYDPGKNAADRLDVSVNAGASTPVGVAPPETITVQTDLDLFLSRFNSAFEAGDIESLIEGLHPAVFDLYGEEACSTYISQVISNPVRIEIVEVIDFGDWFWEIDGNTTMIMSAYTVVVNITAQGETNQQTVHYALRPDGSIGWFTDCGEPLG